MTTRNRRADAKAPPPALRNFYRSVVDEAEALLEADEVEGIDHEVALLRLKLRETVHQHPQDFALFVKGVEMIVRAVAARYRMSPRKAQDLAEHLAAVVDTLADQLLGPAA